MLKLREAFKVEFAYEKQIIPAGPMEPHDIKVALLFENLTKGFSYGYNAPSLYGEIFKFKNSSIMRAGNTPPFRAEISPNDGFLLLQKKDALNFKSQG